MLYCQIAQALQEISQAPRRRKVDLTARLLADQGPEMLCPAVRLLLGELWMPWEEREMGIGPEALMAALAEVSEGDVDRLRERMGEMGMVAEAALQQKGQHSLCSEPLQAISVYERLRRVSRMKGKESEQRKNALLRGLFLQATPLEGKYIARTALRNMLAGIGHKTILAAFFQAFHGDQTRILRAYNLMPDPGRVASMAATSGLEGSVVQPKTPINFMIIRNGRAMNPESRGENREIVILPKYPGLRVQVHKIKGETLIFTTGLHNITATLNGLSQQLGAIEEDFIVDADLIGFQEGKICRQSEMLKYINRRRLSRRSRLQPAILAYDLIYLSGEDTCSRPYLERRKMLVATLGEPRALPFSDISPAEEMCFGNNETVKDRLARAGRCGGEGLVVRDLQAAYTPGFVSCRDFIINSEATIAAVIIRAEYGRGKDKPLYARFRVALRSHEELVPVGWAYRGLGQKEILDLSRHLNALVRDQDELGADVTPQVILNLLIRGAYKCPDGYDIQQAVIQEIRLEASGEDADDIERLEEICGR